MRSFKPRPLPYRMAPLIPFRFIDTSNANSMIDMRQLHVVDEDRLLTTNVLTVESLR